MTQLQCAGQDERDKPKELCGKSIVNYRFTTLGSNPRKPPHQSPPLNHYDLLPRRQWTLALSHGFLNRD